MFSELEICSDLRFAECCASRFKGCNLDYRPQTLKRLLAEFEYRYLIMLWRLLESIKVASHLASRAVVTHS